MVESRQDVSLKYLHGLGSPIQLRTAVELTMTSSHVPYLHVQERVADEKWRQGDSAPDRGDQPVTSPYFSDSPASGSPPMLAIGILIRSWPDSLPVFGHLLWNARVFSTNKDL